MDKPAWNTELHDWVGIATEDEVLTADSFFEYFRAGFTGMSGWLFLDRQMEKTILNFG